eukprot:TRINITY_DN393_c0_g2_i1.p1 TRINITY_DN393_c0_g2~~TRINITY_DN393_c0_g2_i1.p1  ORF type:complete len:458 (+),score=131.15 TRINITY_DN393_c0_g2_i1:67-1374(+)
MDHAKWASTARLFTEDSVQEKFEGWFGKGNITEIGEALRSPPRVTTLRMFRADDDVESVIRDVQAAVGSSRTVRRHDVIEGCIVIEPLGSAPPAAERHPQSIVVDFRCGEAVLRGADVFAPGILASTSRFEEGTKLNILVALDSKETPLKGSMVDRDMCGPDSPSLVHVASGVAVMPRAAVIKQGASGVAVRVTSRVVDHPPMDGVATSACMLQNIPSMLPPLLLRPAPGMRVIDMCAAPGGKTTHVVDLMQRSGEVFALDRSARRLAELQQLAEQAGASVCLKTEKFDATKSLKKFGEKSFDRVLLDPPCSGLGLRPRLRHDMKLAELEEFASYQRKLMATAVALCKPGGRIVYSTCSISPIENEGNVAWLLSEHRGKVELEPPSDQTRKYCELGSPGLKGCGLADEACDAVVRFNPAKDSWYTGFFVASFIRK